MEKIEVKIKKIKDNAVMPHYATVGAAGMDLSAAIDEPIVFKPLERKLVSTGLVLELPQGYEAQIRPRSGMSIKFGMTLINCIGTIDEDYRGEVCVPMVNISNEEYTINAGDRIAQMVISPVQQATLVEVSEVNETERAAGGFGSTGFSEKNLTKTGL